MNDIFQMKYLYKIRHHSLNTEILLFWSNYLYSPKKLYLIYCLEKSRKRVYRDFRMWEFQTSTVTIKFHMVKL